MRYIDDKYLNIDQAKDYISLEDFYNTTQYSRATISRWYRFEKYFKQNLDKDMQEQIPKLPVKVRIRRKLYFFKPDLKKFKDFKKFLDSHRGITKEVHNYKIRAKKEVNNA